MDTGRERRVQSNRWKGGRKHRFHLRKYVLVDDTIDEMKNIWVKQLSKHNMLRNKMAITVLQFGFLSR